jgi:hypothetical protein
VESEEGALIVVKLKDGRFKRIKYLIAPYVRGYKIG